MNFNHDMGPHDVVRKDLNGIFEISFQPSIFKDLHKSFDALFSLDSGSWQTIPNFKTMQKVGFSSTTRVFLVHRYAGIRAALILLQFMLNGRAYVLRAVRKGDKRW